MRKNFILLGVLLVYTMFSCTDNDDNFTVIQDTEDEIKDFIWKGLNYWYLWQPNVDNLSDEKLYNSEEYISFLKNDAYGNTPEMFFDNLLKLGDRFSWIDSDYTNLENNLAGVGSNGLEFGLFLASSSSNDVYGVVRYVHPNSNAETKEISRGDIFNGVNGQTLTTENYSTLLYGTVNSYTLNMASISNSSIVSNGKSVTLTKDIDFQKNPIHINKVIEISGSKIGYLMYNQFLYSFNDELESVFSEFKSQNINDLIIDLRYNRGGSVANCVRLASHITGQFEDRVFIKQVWNDKVTPYLKEENYNFETKFDTSISSLNLNRLYVITSSTSASASEMLINGLDTYIEVIQVGDRTVGKNVGSITLKDIENGYLNPNHKYAMQPIVLKIVNSNNFGDYDNGLIPDVTLKEKISTMGVLGEITEPLLATTLSKIMETSTQNKSTQSETLFHKEIIPLLYDDNMYIETPSFLKYTHK